MFVRNFTKLSMN